MKNIYHRFINSLKMPLTKNFRILMVVLSILLINSFLLPVWQFRLIAPQYPEGLDIDIYVYKIKGGHNDQHIEEINTLNHYIGMKTLNRADLKDLDWIPFAIGLLIILGIRGGIIGRTKDLLDLLVISLYFTFFISIRFIYTLYEMGHNLDPTAPVNIEPFMPVIFGSKQIANFTTYSLPSWGSLFLFSFVIGILSIIVVNFRKSSKI